MKASKGIIYSAILSIPIWFLIFKLYSERFLVIEIISNLTWFYKSLISTLGG